MSQAKEKATGWRKTLARAQALRAAGEGWRAREVLQGAIRSAYHPDLYRAYGEILFDLGDRYAAGKFLLLAGVTPGEEPYGAAVRLFQERHRRTTGYALLGLLPRSFRQAEPDEWPEAAVRWLAERWCAGQPGPCADNPREALRRAGLGPPPLIHEGLPPALRWGLPALVVYLLLAALAGTGLLCYGVWLLLRHLSHLL